jgi:hypothetical protein
MLAALSALLMLLLASAAAFGMNRRWGWSSPVRQTHARHRITRIICGVLGLGLVVAITISTILDIRRVYEAPTPLSLRRPALAPPVRPSGEGAFEGGRFLLHMVLVTATEGSMQPLAGETFDVNWPRDRNRPFHTTLRHGAGTVHCEVSLTQIERPMRETTEYPKTYCSYSVSSEGMSYSCHAGGSTFFPKALQFSRGGDAGFFSMARTADETEFVLLDLTALREDDPLKAAGFADFVSFRNPEYWKDEIHVSTRTLNAPDQFGSPALGLIEGLRGNVIILLAAAILLGQVFRRPSLGFAKVAACLLLFVGGLDRLTLRVHESRLRDGTAPLERRLSACAHVPTTTFFPKTALRDLEAVASDPAAPEALQKLARQLAERERRIHFP